MFFSQREYYEETFEDIEVSEQEIRSIEFEDCNFVQCDFSEKIFWECKFSHCHFTQCNLSLMKVAQSTYCDVVFEDSKVMGVNWSEISLPKIPLACPIKFLRCNISNSSFLGMNLPKTSIKDCVAKDVDFREANLCESNLTHTDFSESHFMQTNLSKCDFSHAKNYRIDIAMNKIEKAKFSLPEALSLLYLLDIEIDN
ncbi:pentapeptide repeat-containing protein [Candidatus Uabimicrobium amorphum]|uniref:Pentapeptide repeat-containing protein n=1 Tax=Uabimicrobium amorphum TaxID=2596890 RepID=A0A5S9F4M1_UABAM|nr:pentapeptide repeat-containing protein [Candidatus Uabimicrobium amorphum]BBM85926.1 hypothetical protein UABAM_04312 [Candidatus Uabimicrobium amorphum]